MTDSQQEFLTVSELAQRIKYSPQTLYNMISSKKFVKGQHYIKPSRRKILFIWSGILVWLESQDNAFASSDTTAVDTNSAVNRIRI